MANLFGAKEPEYAPDFRPEKFDLCGQGPDCKQVIREPACIQALVTLTPEVEVGEVKTKCLGDAWVKPFIGFPNPATTCQFVVNQMVCVQIPLTFSAAVTAEPLSIACGEKQKHDAHDGPAGHDGFPHQPKC